MKHITYLLAPTLKLLSSLCLILILSIVCASCFAQMPAQSLHGARLSYVNWDESNSYYRLDFETFIAWVGHPGRAFKTCQQNESFYCLNVERQFNFTVPKQFPSVGQQWSKDGEDFSVERSIEQSMFGKLIRAIVIRSNKAKRSFIYSEQLGLLAIKTPKHTYWLDGPRGFPWTPCGMHKAWVPLSPGKSPRYPRVQYECDRL